MLIHNLVGSCGFYSETCQIIRVSSFVFPNQIFEEDVGQKINASHYANYQNRMYTLEYTYDDNDSDKKQVHSKLNGSQPIKFYRLIYPAHCFH